MATDSFHSCVFSILFSTPFIVFERDDKELESMYSRIETLLEKFNIQDRIFKEKITADVLRNDYTKVYEILDKERTKVNNFLNSAFI